jgi:hypothetical protein
MKNTSSAAMLKGAVVSGLTAAVITSFAGAVATAAWTRPSEVAWYPYGEQMAWFFLSSEPEEPPAAWLLSPGFLYVAVAVLIGMIAGRIAAKLDGSVLKRTLVLFVLSPLGPFVVALATFTWSAIHSAVFVRGLGGSELASQLGTYVEALPLLLVMTCFGLVGLYASFLGPPIVVGVLLIEGWTRPNTLASTWFARPNARRAIFLMAVCLVLMFGLFTWRSGWSPRVWPT